MEERGTMAGGVSRRAFCRLLGASMLWPASTALAVQGPRRRELRMANLHTGEDLDLTYRTGDAYDPAAVREINQFLRCPHTGQVADIDLAVVDLLWDVCRKARPGARVQIISGYRSPEYNEYLRQKGRQVAKHSLHMEGLAIDFAVPGTRPRRLARIARELAVGGVGTYPDFVHIDSGPVRYW